MCDALFRRKDAAFPATPAGHALVGSERGASATRRDHVVSGFEHAAGEMAIREAGTGLDSVACIPTIDVSRFERIVVPDGSRDVRDDDGHGQFCSMRACEAALRPRRTAYGIDDATLLRFDRDGSSRVEAVLRTSF